MPAVLVDGREIDLSNLDKVFWPREGYTKAHLLQYYHEIAPFILRYLKDRPIVMNRFPDGITGENFYQKERPAHTPSWIQTVAVDHEDAGRRINYILCQNEPTLLWLVNQGCIEIHAWLSRSGSLEYPDIAVLDLDPMPGATFDDVRVVALLVREVLDHVGLDGFPKTSGATGLHVFIPIAPAYTFKEVARAMGVVAQAVARVSPRATVERVIARRGPRVYVDYLQNVFGKTMAFPYSVRPLPGAPVSTPITWEELQLPVLLPARFSMVSVPGRLKEKGDLYAGLLDRKQSLDTLLRQARR
ncbi:MAG: non-homologous end-joining DNA ligase [Bacillota bacterium]